MSAIKGGFFIYRGSDEIVGAVVIKEYGERQFFMYCPIDPANADYGMETMLVQFADTTVPNPYDNNQTNVFDMAVFDKFIEKLTQTSEP